MAVDVQKTQDELKNKLLKKIDERINEATNVDELECLVRLFAYLK